MQPKPMFKILSIIALCGLMAGCVTTAPKTGSAEIKARYLSANKAYTDKNYELALLEYLELSETLRAVAIIWFRIGNSYARLENFDKAIEAYEKTVLIDPRLSKAWHNMGVIQLKQSVNTWRQMLIYISKDDPLYDKALNLSKKLLEVADGKQTSE
jgi:tetratricopeptide (TPR) repeat protein